MPEQQQAPAPRTYVSTDPNWTPDAIDPISSRATTAPPRAESESGFLAGLGRIGKGGAKSIGRTLVDLAALHMGPNAFSLSSRIPQLQSEGGQEQFGGVLGDIATGALASGPARGLGTLRNAATGLESRATGLSRTGSRMALERGAGPVTQRSADILKQAGKDEYQGQQIMRGGRWVRDPKAPQTELERAAVQMQAAVDEPSAPLSAAEIAGGGAGLFGGSPIIGVPAMIAGGIRLARRPGPSSHAAQLLFSGGPTIQAGTPPATSPVAQALMDFMLRRSGQ